MVGSGVVVLKPGPYYPSPMHVLFYVVMPMCHGIVLFVSMQVLHHVMGHQLPALHADALLPHDQFLVGGCKSKTVRWKGKAR